MSVWVLPRTWTNVVTTAADNNGEIRDHLNWLKAFADLITATTASDTGSTTRLRILRTASTSSAYESSIPADTISRFKIDAAGKMTWGDGAGGGEVTIERLAANRVGVTGGTLEIERDTTAGDAIITSLPTDTANRFTIEASGEHQWGDGTAAADVTMYRVSANRLGVGAGDSLQIVGSGTANALEFGPAGAPTTSLYEISAGRLQTSDQFKANSGVITFTKAGIPADGDFTVTPASGMLAVDTVNSRLYVRVGSAWKYVGLI